VHDPLQEEPSSIIIDNQKIGKTNKVFERKKSKEPKQDSENPPSHLCLGRRT
jgi:hypothetical protein